MVRLSPTATRTWWHMIYYILRAIRTFIECIVQELKVKKVSDCTNTGNKSYISTQLKMTSRLVNYRTF